MNSGNADPETAPLAAPDDFYPFVQTPMWIKLLPISTNAREVADFLIAHLNPQTGRMEAWPSVPAIAAHIGRKDRTVQSVIRDELVTHGVVEVVPMYDDNLTRKRTSSPTDARGANNAQSMNSYKPRLTPPDGMLHPGPISLPEFYDLRKRNPEGLVQDRIDREHDRRRNVPPAQPTAPGIEQGKRANSQVTPRRNESHPPGATNNTPPVSSAAPKEQQPEEQQLEEEFHPSSWTSEAQFAHENVPNPRRSDGWTDGATRKNPHSATQKSHATPPQGHTAGDTGNGPMGSEQSDQEPATAGSVLLINIERRHGVWLSGQRAEYVAAIDAALAVLPERQVVATLGDGLNRAHTPSGALVERIRGDLSARVAERQREHERSVRQREQDRAARQQRSSTTVASAQTRAAAMAAVPAAEQRTRSSERGTRRLGQVSRVHAAALARARETTPPT